MERGSRIISLLSSIASSVAAAIPAGTNLIGKVGIDQVTADANRVVICGVQGDGTITPIKVDANGQILIEGM